GLLPARRNLLDRPGVPGTRTRQIDGIPERVRRRGRHPGDGQRGRAGGRDRLAIAVRPVGRLELARRRGWSLPRPRSVLAPASVRPLGAELPRCLARRPPGWEEGRVGQGWG